MVELQDRDVGLTTVNARMLAQVFGKESPIPCDGLDLLFGRPIKISRPVPLIKILFKDLLTCPARRVAFQRNSITKVELLDRL